MEYKKITIDVPNTWEIPEILMTLSGEENAFILEMGVKTIKEARNYLNSLSQNEIYEKVREETKEELEKLQSALLVEKRVGSELSVSIKKFYEERIEDMNRKIVELKQQLTQNREDNSGLIKDEVEKTEIKFMKMLDEKETIIKQLNNQNNVINMLIQNQNSKSNVQKGKEGEDMFEYFANETFRDFTGYTLIDKHMQSGAGDFHLNFDEFGILVDAKNYKKKVPISQRDKIKKDLIKNEHLTFAWLVSLNTTIDTFDKAPVMYEWVNTKQCVVYINNLLEFEDPKKLLRIVWFTCNELFSRMVNEYNNEEIEEYRKYKFEITDRIKSFRKRIRELNVSVNATKNLLELFDDELKGILSNETNAVVESNYGVFDEWWTENVEEGNEEEVITSTDLWFKFKKDNKQLVEDYNLNTEKFKEYIKVKIPETRIVLKGKSINSAYNIKGCALKTKSLLLKNNEIVSKNNEIANINFNIDVKPKQIEKKRRIKKGDIYFDELLDEKIIKEYEEQGKDIMDIANQFDVKAWQVVSLLVKRKIIQTRNDAKGYDKYKETEEYKSKITK